MTQIVDMPSGSHNDTYSAGSAALRTHPVPRLAGPMTCTANLDPTLAVTAANADFYRQFAITSSDTCGRPIYDLLHPSARSVLPRHFEQLAEGRRSRFVERVVARRGVDGVFSARMTGIAVRGARDGLSGIVLLTTPDETVDSADVPYDPKPLLTTLDARILEGIAIGSSTQQLATRLYLSRQGVEYHVGLMLRRLKAPNRAALVSRAYSLGILTIGVWPPRALPEFVK